MPSQSQYTAGSLLVADEAQLLAERDDALHDLLLHQVEAHGQHGHPEEDVHEAEQELEGKWGFNREKNSN